MDQRETRSINSKLESSGNTLTGYAAVWDSPTTINMPGKSFTEIVRRSAFSRTLDGNRDIICTFDHDPASLLGRRSSGTLTVTPDEHGLKYEVVLPDTTTGRDLKTLVERGDVYGGSFTFGVRADKWTNNTRELLDLELYELGPVTMPAYPSTSLSLRSNSAWYKAKLKLYTLQ
jgi:HK97 family phage prohead protease